MQKEQLKIVKIEIDKITPYKNNAKLHPREQIEQIKQSIIENGFNDPIAVWGEGNIIVEGHGRLIACKELGYKEIECIRLDHLTEEQRKAYTLTHNKLTMNSGFDEELLELELEELQGLGVDVIGFEFEDDEDEEATEVEQDEIPEVDEQSPPITQLGDIWQLGRHRLMCGDSTDALNIDLLMNGAKADLVFTDPPYGMKKEKDGVANDNLNYDDLLTFNKEWIPLTFEALKENGSWYCWGIDEPLMDIYANILRPLQMENKITFRNLITWDKGSGQGQLSAEFRMYPTADEKCLFVMCGVQGFNNNKDHYDETFEAVRSYLESEAKRAGLTSKLLTEITGVQMFGHWFTKSQFTIIPETHYKKLQEYYKGEAFTLPYNELQGLFDAKEHKTLKAAIMAKRAFFDNTHDNMNNVWHFNRTSADERELTGGHATPKPIALCARAIKSSSRKGEIVLDVFGGSGSTLVACEQLNRSAYLMELEPKWCDVIVKRWENLTGEKAVRL